MRYKLFVVFLLSSTLLISSVFGHVIIPPQFIKYAQDNPQSSIAQMQSVIDEWGTMDEIEGLSGMTSKELATRIIVGYGSGDKSELIPYQKTIIVEADAGLNISFDKIIATIWVGLIHVRGGWDHVFYIISLIFILTSWRKLLIGLSLFSATHSIALFLTILGYISFPSTIAEIFIAISIVITSIMSLLYKHKSFSISTIYVSILFFGLFHGLGFASVFTDLGYSIDTVISSLIGFTIGVEFAQISIIIVVGGVLHHLKDRRYYKILCNILQTIIMVFGIIWLLQSLI